MVEVPLTKGKVALIDDEDAERVLAYRWCVSRKLEGSYYVVRQERKNGCRRYISLHRFLLDAPKGIHVDHINGDTLDNRRANLRLATARQNVRNSRKPRNSTTGYKGVHLDRTQGTYRVQLRVAMSGFRTAEEAARAYDDLARKFYGEFARLNFPDESEQGA